MVWLNARKMTMSKASKRARAASKSAAIKTTHRVRDAVKEQAHRDKRLSVDPVQRLIDGATRSASEHSLTLGEEQAAREIPRVYSLVIAGIFTKAQNLEGGSGGAGGAGMDRMDKWHPADVAAYLERYKPWANDLTNWDRDALSVVVDFLVDERPLAQIDRDHRWRNGTARRLIRESLRRYATAAGWQHYAGPYSFAKEQAA